MSESEPIGTERINADTGVHEILLPEGWTVRSGLTAAAAVASKDENTNLRDEVRYSHADIVSLHARVRELESYSHEMAINLDKRNTKDQETEAYQYLKRLFLHLAPQCCALPDLLGVCTQLDNAIAGLKIEIAELNAKLVTANVATAVINSGGTFADGPDPPYGAPAPSFPVPAPLIPAVQPPKEHNPFRDFPTDPRRMGP